MEMWVWPEVSISWFLIFSWLYTSLVYFFLNIFCLSFRFLWVWLQWEFQEMIRVGFMKISYLQCGWLYEVHLASSFQGNVLCPPFQAGTCIDSRKHLDAELHNCTSHAQLPWDPSSFLAYVQKQRWLSISNKPLSR